MDASQTPLIADHEQDDTYHEPDEQLSRHQHNAPTKPKLFVIALTFAAGISGLLFGYDTGVISATLVSIGTALSQRELTSLDKSVITSSTALFALLISPFSSLLADKFGRKQVILYADVLFVIGAVLQAISSTVFGMVLGRCVIGAAVGAASFVVPLYIAEIAPASYRGRLVTTNVVFITLGQMVAYVVGWLFSTYGHQDTAWRWMVGLGAVPAAVQGILVTFMPETPRWLVKAGMLSAAVEVVKKSHSDGDDIEAIVKLIEREARQEREARANSIRGVWKELISVGGNRRALVIACLLQGLQQLCGFNSLMYFSATIFTMVGFSSPTLMSLTVAVTNFVFTLAALALIDGIGRRRMLLYSIPFMIFGLLLASAGFSRLPLVFSSSTTNSEQQTVTSAAGVILLSIIVYVASYALGLGNVPWMQSELFPLSVRSLGSGLATATNWTANFIVGLTFLPLMDVLTPTWTFVLYAVVCGAGYIAVWRIYPETAGLSLEEATGLLEDGWGV